MLVYRNRNLAVIEAKSDDSEVGEGVGQAKNYAKKLRIPTTFACNGKEIYKVEMGTGVEGLVPAFPTPDELWKDTFSERGAWHDSFDLVPYNDVGGSKPVRYYQEIAVNKAMEAIAEDKTRILLTLATGTGKAFIAFQIAWKLFNTRWNLRRDASRRPRILFLADRNILADQAFNAFNPFPDDALVRIRPNEILSMGKCPPTAVSFSPSSKPL